MNVSTFFFFSSSPEAWWCLTCFFPLHFCCLHFFLNTFTTCNMYELAHLPKRSTNRLLLHRIEHLNMLLFKAGSISSIQLLATAFELCKTLFVGGPVNLVNNLVIWAAAWKQTPATRVLWTCCSQIAALTLKFFLLPRWL